MDEMVERVTRAVLGALERRPLIDAGHGQVNRIHAQQIARAAIEAMREPTDAMYAELGGDCLKWAPGAWKTMIDAALTAPEGK